jgi:hypothetical protein
MGFVIGCGFVHFRETVLENRDISADNEKETGLAVAASSTRKKPDHLGPRNGI